MLSQLALLIVTQEVHLLLEFSSTNVAEMAIGCGYEAERDSVLAFLAADS